MWCTEVAAGARLTFRYVVSGDIGDHGRYLVKPMACRTHKLATAISTALLFLFLLLFVTGYLTNPWNHYLSINDSFHVCVWNRGLDSRIVFFNDAEYGPYRGSIIGIEGADGNVSTQRLRENAFIDAWGIYYRYFQWPKAKIWTLMISLWYPILLFAILPVALLTHQRFRLTLMKTK